MSKSITTYTGDKGETRLYSGETVSKRSRRICACGEIDELVSVIGVAKANLYLSSTNKYTTDNLTWIQRQLFRVASEIAMSKDFKDKITTDDVIELDERRSKLEEQTELPKGFILPGTNPLSAQIDLSRAVARRCEREIVWIYNEGFIDNKDVLIWMNRVSDFLYLLARYNEDTRALVKENNKNE